MGRVITQVPGRGFQTLCRAFSFLLKPQTSTECFKSSSEPFEGSAACFETNARPSILMDTLRVFDNLVCKKQPS